MIRSVLSLATLQRQPNNVTCCMNPLTPTLTPPGFLSRFVLHETIAHPARESPVSRIPSPSYEFHLSRASAMNARTHTNRVSNLLLCAWVRVHLSVHSARNPHSRTADCDVAIILRVCIDGLLFFTHELRYFSRSSDAFRDSLRSHTRQLSGIV